MISRHINDINRRLASLPSSLAKCGCGVSMSKHRFGIKRPRKSIDGTFHRSNLEKEIIRCDSAWNDGGPESPRTGAWRG